MPDSNSSDPPLEGFNSLQYIFNSALDLISLLGPSSPSQSSSESTIVSPIEELILEDIKQPSRKLKKFKLSSSEMKEVLRVYRSKLDSIKAQIQAEYKALCQSLPVSMHLQIISTLSDYWIRTRDSVMSQMIELVADTVRMIRPKKVGRRSRYSKKTRSLIQYLLSCHRLRRESLSTRWAHRYLHLFGHSPPVTQDFVPLFEYIFGRVGNARLSSKDKRFLATLSDMEYQQIATWVSAVDMFNLS
jgi:hypothetical protein